jgi:hypothetical protein
MNDREKFQTLNSFLSNTHIRNHDTIQKYIFKNSEVAYKCGGGLRLEIPRQLEIRQTPLEPAFKVELSLKSKF